MLERILTLKMNRKQRYFAAKHSSFRAGEGENEGDIS
jgi:hypothetical protein